MGTGTDAGTAAGGPIELRRERQRGLAQKIAAARARRDEARITREDFMDDPVVEVPEVFEPKHREFREELRRIIADDAERAANEAGAPLVEQTDPDDRPPARRSIRVRTAVIWLTCLLGLGAIAYGVTATG